MHVGPVWPGKSRAQMCGESLGTRLLYSSGLVPRLVYNWNEAKLTFLVAWGEERMVIGMQAQLLKVRRDHYTLWSRVNTAVTMSLPAVPSRLPEGLESAGRLVDQHLKTDQTYVELSGQLRIATHRKSTYEVWSCTGWGMKLHELVSSARGCAISIYCTPQVFVERLMRLFWSILLLTNYVDSYSSLSIVYSLVRDYACGQVLRAIWCSLVQAQACKTAW